MARILRLALLVGICLMIGFLGSLATRTSAEDWYQQLSKPSWTPPDWLFGPVWTALYIVMAVAAWLVWQKASSVDVRPALGLFGGQLLLNLFWSLLFFGMRWPGGALVEIGFLLVAILATALAFARISALAGWLLAPYLAWVSFAALLNFEIWQQNG